MGADFPAAIPEGLWRGIYFRWRRWRRFRWMRRMAYGDSLPADLLRTVWRHLRRHLSPLRRREAEERVRRAARPFL
ncbi:hypothetical protein [Alistipes sp. An54]|uniref:hypothetical protein n=1 Tax=Alistipes sp. An54 TaxID=1965645 RepID=UPI0011781168|nr:hypothetical protein [Alistipes sp. An54]